MIKDNEIQSVDLFVTEECNMNCDYCFHKQSPLKLDLETGKKILDKLKEMSPDNMKLNFFGGEPLLYPKLVLGLMHYSNEIWGKDNVGFHVVTNGTYFDEEVFKEFLNQKMKIQFSIDGDETTQMEHRKGNFKLVTENIKKTVAMFPKDMLNVRMTITPKTVGRLSINVPFIREELGITQIMHHATMEDNWDNEILEVYEKQLQQLYHYRRFLKKNGRDVFINFIDKPLQVLNDEASSTDDFCQAGKTYLAILPNGETYPCHRAASNRIFKLGDLLNDKPIIRGMFLEIDKVRTGCDHCPAVRTCHSCPITHYLVNGDLLKPLHDNGYCKVCFIENEQAKRYLSTELSDRFERKLDTMGRVIVDMVQDQDVMIQKLNKLLEERNVLK